jgi:hypothetical protein
MRAAYRFMSKLLVPHVGGGFEIGSGIDASVHYIAPDWILDVPL